MRKHVRERAGLLTGKVWNKMCSDQPPEIRHIPKLKLGKSTGLQVDIQVSPPALLSDRSAAQEHAPGSMAGPAAGWRAAGPPPAALSCSAGVSRSQPEQTDSQVRHQSQRLSDLSEI